MSTATDYTIVVPNSAGTAPPQWHLPPLACDCHMHIFDPAIARAAGSTGSVADQATVAEYRLLQRRLGTERAVVVTPRFYDTNNQATLDAIRLLGPARTRGVAVVATDIADRDLLTLREQGIRGVRFTTPHLSATDRLFAQVASLAPRLESAGLHLQLHWTVEQIVAHAELILSLPCTVVIDHMGRLPRGIGMAHPAYSILRRRLDDGRTWVKLSGWYLDSDGPPYADTIACGASFAAAAPERMVWGSDWPHVSEAHKPDGAVLVDTLAVCVPDAALRRRILVDNPAQLYDF